MSLQSPPAFELRNAGVGPDPLSLAHVQELVDFAILLFLRDYHCPKCRAQVDAVIDQTGPLEQRDTAVIPVLPESYERAVAWGEAFDLPIPLLADPDSAVASAYGQERRFGVVGKLHDVIGRMPKAVVLDLRAEPRIVADHQGSTPGDRPALAALLETVDDLREEFVFDCELVEC